MNEKIVHVDVEDNYRLVVISDVHGDVDTLDRLLGKLNLEKEDYLILLGDFLNRGPKNYETYVYVRELGKRDRTLIMKGNHESFMQRHLAENEHIEYFVDFLKAEYYETMISELVKMAGHEVQAVENGADLVAKVGPRGAEVRTYLASLPILAYFDDMILVHGGYNKDYTMEDNETDYLKYDSYNATAEANEKTVIVGHWPASELRNDCLSNLPFHNEEKKIISIDGGNVIKDSGELNAFIIEKRDGQVIHSLVQENNFKPMRVVRNHHFETEPLVYLTYPNHEVELVEQGAVWSVCRQISTGKTFRVFSSLIEERDQGHDIRVNYINRFLNLSVGETVQVAKAFEDCVMVKYGDEFGWLWVDQVG